jgi:hypothetical protein
MRVLCAPTACAPGPRSAAEIAGPPFLLEGPPAKTERTPRESAPSVALSHCARSPRFLTLKASADFMSPGSGARESWLATLDPGIAPHVAVLDATGIETFVSCEGGRWSFVPGADSAVLRRTRGGLPCSRRRPSGRPSASQSAAALLDRPNGGAPDGPNWEMTFWRPTDPLGQPLALLALVAAVRLTPCPQV